MSDEKESLLGENVDDNKLRKLLIIGGVFFLVFVIVIIIYKFVSGSNNNDTKVILPPEIKEKSELFNNIPIDKDDKVEVKKEVVDTPVEVKSEPLVKTDVVEEKEKRVTPKVEKVENKEEVTIKKPVVKKTKVVVEKNYYIQVASLIKFNPSKKFLSLIKQEGFNYEIKEVERVRDNRKIKVKLVLIGPYETRNDALKSLKKVRKKIASGAFIKKL